MRLFKNLLLLIASFIFALAVAEALVRIFAPSNPNYHVRDPYIGRRLIPNAEFHFEGGGRESDIKINSLGWNSREFTIEKPKGIKRIVHIGDSQVENIRVSTEENFTTLLNTLLPGTENLNLSIAGRGTYPELLTYRHYGRKYDPDVVILWFTTGNDFRDNYLVRNIISGSGQSGRLRIRSGRLGWMRKILIQNLRLPRFLYDHTSNIAIVPRVLISLGLLSMEPEEFEEDIPLTYRTSVIDTPERKEALRITENLLQAFAGEVDKGEFVVALMPSLFEVGYDTKGELQDLYPALENVELDKGFSARELKRITTKLNIPFIDLTSSMKQAYANGKQPYIPGDGHISAAGNRVIAGETAKWLNEHFPDLTSTE